MDVPPHVGETVLDVVEVAGQHIGEDTDEVLHEFPHRVDNVRPHRHEHVAHELPRRDDNAVDDDLENLPQQVNAGLEAVHHRFDERVPYQLERLPQKVKRRLRDVVHPPLDSGGKHVDTGLEEINDWANPRVINLAHGGAEFSPLLPNPIHRNTDSVLQGGEHAAEVGVLAETGGEQGLQGLPLITNPVENRLDVGAVRVLEKLSGCVPRCFHEVGELAPDFTALFGLGEKRPQGDTGRRNRGTDEDNGVQPHDEVKSGLDASPHLRGSSNDFNLCCQLSSSLSRLDHLDELHCLVQRNKLSRRSTKANSQRPQPRRVILHKPANRLESVTHAVHHRTQSATLTSHVLNRTGDILQPTGHKLDSSSQRANKRLNHRGTKIRKRRLHVRHLRRQRLAHLLSQVTRALIHSTNKVLEGNLAVRNSLLNLLLRHTHVVSQILRGIHTSVGHLFQILTSDLARRAHLLQHTTNINARALRNRGQGSERINRIVHRLAQLHAGLCEHGGVLRRVSQRHAGAGDLLGQLLHLRLRLVSRQTNRLKHNFSALNIH